MNVKPIKDLLSEAGAEVIIDQIDIDDTDLKVSTVQSVQTGTFTLTLPGVKFAQEVFTS